MQTHTHIQRPAYQIEVFWAEAYAVLIFFSLCKSVFWSQFESSLEESKSQSLVIRKVPFCIAFELIKSWSLCCTNLSGIGACFWTEFQIGHCRLLQEDSKLRQGEKLAIGSEFSRRAHKNKEKWSLWCCIACTPFVSLLKILLTPTASFN